MRRNHTRTESTYVKDHNKLKAKPDKPLRRSKLSRYIMGYGNCENLRLRTIYTASLRIQTECGQLPEIHSGSTGASKLLDRVVTTNPTVTTKSLHLYQGCLTTISLSHISMFEFNTKTNNAGKSTRRRQVL